MGRNAIYDQPMTAAQRKERSRSTHIGNTLGHLNAAARLCSEWRKCMASGRPVTDKDIESAFEEIGLMIAAAQLAMPQS